MLQNASNRAVGILFHAEDTPIAPDGSDAARHVLAGLLSDRAVCFFRTTYLHSLGRAKLDFAHVAARNCVLWQMRVVEARRCKRRAWISAERKAARLPR